VKAKDDHRNHRGGYRSGARRALFYMSHISHSQVKDSHHSSRFWSHFPCYAVSQATNILDVLLNIIDSLGSCQLFASAGHRGG